MRITESELRHIINEEVQNFLFEDEIINEEFSNDEKQELQYLIRQEIADVMYDLFRRKNFWVTP